MKKNAKLQTIAVSSYITAAVLFLLFFLYMAFFENVSIYQAREQRTYVTVTDYSVTEIPDSQAPAGIRKEYSWTLEDINTNENCLGFYLVHQYAEVYFDNELMYRLMPQENNKLGKSISSNWIMIPLYPEDYGKEVRIIITPVYQSSVNREIEFEIGSRSSILIHRLKLDFPQLFLSALCILLGLFIMIVQLSFLVRKKAHSWDLFYLGNFSVLLGIWKITDTRFSSLLFHGNTMVLGYITIGMLFLICIPFLLFIRERFSGYMDTVFLGLSTAVSAAAVAVLICQISGIAEFRETLSVSHVLIIVSTVTLLAVSMLRNIKYPGPGARRSRIVVLFLAVSALIDIITYYKRGSSSGVICLIIVFLVYLINLFAASMLEIRKNAYTDIHTGLFNKSRWNNLMETITPANGPIGFMMIDLNRLKYINDTMGHEAGDKVIFTFANILRNTIPKNNVICRWGGDEFAVLILDATREKMEAYLSTIAASVDNYNQSGGKPEIYFAAGYSLSTDHPELSSSDLFEKADEQMYQNKQNWYASHPDDTKKKASSHDNRL